MLGKRSGHLPEQAVRVRPGDHSQDALHAALHVGPKLRRPPATTQPPADRAPSLCPSCPHRSAFFAARAVFGDDAALLQRHRLLHPRRYAPPLKAGDALLCMGAGFTLAAGVARTTGKQTLGFHGGLDLLPFGHARLMNAIKSDVDMVAVIMDNGVTAMTGFQESPSAKIVDGRSEHMANIEAAARALGAQARGDGRSGRLWRRPVGPSNALGIGVG